MSTNQRIHLVDIPVGGHGGFIWNGLHGEREEICAAMLKDYQPTHSDDSHQETSAEDRKTQYWHLELLQARLRKIDEALDRLMSGSYGICATCAHPIEISTLALDPAVGFCSECWKRNQTQSSNGAPTSKELTTLQGTKPTISEVSLESLNQFDTILLQTHYSHYRLLLLDPKAGRALAQGGKFLSEPKEVLVTGSRRNGCLFKIGTIRVGSQLEMWLGDEIIVTSPIGSVQIEHAEANGLLDSIVIADQIV
jgi:RNA polymerase-binding transcription factor DksA